MKYQGPLFEADGSSYTDVNPVAGIEGSIVGMKAIEHPQRELDHLIDYAGLTPSEVDLEQVRKAIEALIAAAVISEPGDYKWSARASCTGYLLCNGAAVSRATYAALFAVIGTTYGAGDGSTTFNLPDIRQRFPIMAGAKAGLTPRTLGEPPGGEEAHKLILQETPPHKHTIPFQGPGGATAPNSAVTGAATLDTSTVGGFAGEAVPHNNMPPWFTMNLFIKT